jgi:predicted nucleic acid-binding protein
MVIGVVIADAGPLIALARIGHLDLLRQLFGAVTLTSVVAAEIGLDRWGEIASARAGAAAIAEALRAGWLTVPDPGLELGYEPLNPGVDPGERSSIALALQLQAAGRSVLLIVDDRCGRAEARSQGLAILGTAAVLVLAKEQSLIPASAPLLVALRDQGYFLSDALVAAVLDQAGEA